MGKYIDEEDPNAAHLAGFKPQPLGGVVGTTAGIIGAINPETAVLATGKVLYDTFQAGAWVGNSINEAGLNPLLGFEPTTSDDLLIDHTTEFWEAAEKINGNEFDTYTKGVANITAFAGSTMSFASKIAALPKFAQLAKSKGLWNGMKKSFYVGGPAGAAADLIHTRASDGRVLDMIPEEHRPEFLDWMVDRTNESELEGRAKNIIEGIALGMGFDTGFELFRYFKSSKNMIQELSGSPQELKDNLIDTLGDGDHVEAVTDAYVGATNTGRIFTNDELPKKGADILKTDVEIHQATKGTKPKKKATDDDFDPTSLDAIDRSPQANKVRTMVKNLGESEESTLRVVDNILSDPNATAKELADAEYMKNVLEEDGVTLMNHKLHGDFVSSEAMRIFEAAGLLKELERGKKAITSKSHLESAVAALRKVESGEAFKNPDIWNKLKGEGFGDMKGITRALLAHNASEEEMVQIIQIAMRDRNVKAESFSKAANALMKKMDDPNVQNSAELQAFLKAYEASDEIISAIEGSASTSGRMLGLHRHGIDNSPMKFLKEHKQDRALRDEAARTGADIEELRVKRATPDTGQSTLQVVMNDKDSRAFKKLVKLAADDKLKTPAEFKAALEVPSFADVLITHMRGSLLSSPATVSKSVAASNAILTGHVHVIQPLVDSMLNYMQRGLGYDSGHRAVQSLIGVSSLFRNSAKAISNIVSNRGFQKLSDDFAILGDTGREGADTGLGLATRSQLKETFEEIAEKYAREDAYAKAAVLKLIKPFMPSVMAVQNTFVRGIKNMDDVFKGLNTEAYMDRGASEAWFREGGSDMFGDIPVNKEIYLDRFGKLQRKSFKILNDIKLTDDEVKDQLTAIFKGQNRLRGAVIDTIADADKVAKEVTMQTDIEDIDGVIGMGGALLSKLGGMAEKQGAVGKLAFASTFLFTKTPIVFLKVAQDYSLLAFSSKKFYQKIISGTPKERIETFGKVATGLGLWYSAATLAASGKLSGTHSPTERERMKLMKIPESSIYIGGTWYDHSALGPFSVLLDSIANWSTYREKNPGNAIIGMASQTMSVMNQEGHVATVAELIDILQSEDPINKGSRFTVDRILNVITPAKGLTNNFGAVIDNGMYRTTIDKELKGLDDQLKFHFANGLKNNIIFRRGSNMLGGGLYEDDYDLTGGDMFKTGDTMGDRVLHLLGFGTQTAQNDQWRIEMAKQGAIPGNAGSSTIQGVPMTSNQYKDAVRSVATGDMNVDATMNALIKRPGYQKAGPDQKQRMLKDAYGSFVDVYKNELFLSSPDMQKRKSIMDQLKLDRLTVPRGEELPGTEEYYLKARMSSGKLSTDNAEDLEILKDVLKIK